MAKPISYSTCHPDRPVKAHGMCKTCWATHYYNLPEIRARRARWSHEWNVNHIASRLLTGAKKRAQKLGVPCTITKEDISVPETCPVLGIPLVPAAQGRRLAQSPSLDRFIPELGYVPGNITVISWRANQLKNNATLQEVEALLSWMKEQYGTSRG